MGVPRVALAAAWPYGAEREVIKHGFEGRDFAPKSPECFFCPLAAATTTADAAHAELAAALAPLPPTRCPILP